MRVTIVGLAVVAGCSQAPEKKAASEPSSGNTQAEAAKEQAPHSDPQQTMKPPPAPVESPMLGGAPPPPGRDGGGTRGGSAATEAARASGGLGSTTDGDAFRPLDGEKGGDLREKTAAASTSGAAPAPADKPLAIKVQPPTLATKTDETLIKDAVVGARHRYEVCYRSTLALRPNLEGSMTIKFAVAKGSNTLTNIRFAGALKHADLEKCLKEQLGAAKLASNATAATTGSFVIDFAR